MKTATIKQTTFRSTILRQLKIFIATTILTTIISCSKDAPVPGQNNWECGTVADMTWTQNVTANDLTGNWAIWNINYSKGTGNTSTYDTTYSPNAPLTLNSNGTGTIYSLPLNWTVTTSQNSFPKLTITQADTLFPFQVGFLQSGTVDIYLQLPPDTRFYGRASKNGTPWEYADISFKR
jgi:hypothetical protein